jgi:hypothetical protein
MYDDKHIVLGNFEYSREIETYSNREGGEVSSISTARWSEMNGFIASEV